MGCIVAYNDENQLLSIKINHEQNSLFILKSLSHVTITQKLDDIIKCSNGWDLNITYNFLNA